MVFFAVVTRNDIKKRRPIVKHLVNITWLVYSVCVVAITLFPIPIDKRLIQDLLMVNNKTINLNVLPFASIFPTLASKDMSSIIRLLGGNILMFIPLGYLIPITLRKKDRFSKVVLLGLISSVIIELLQLIISYLVGYGYRIVDIDDIILNTVGTMLGFLIYKLTKPALIKLKFINQ